METFYYAPYRSPFGLLTLVASARGLRYLQLPGTTDAAADPLCLFPKRLRTEVDLIAAEAATHPYWQQLTEYFSGQRRQFTFALDMRGTEFQLRCWEALLDIAYGETRTYAEQARRIGHGRAFRAVGMANHDNPLAIVVPCHRVIASDGSLGGYGGGLEMKRKLLELEGARLTARAAAVG